jgi:general secretion pathway protein D
MTGVNEEVFHFFATLQKIQSTLPAMRRPLLFAIICLAQFSPAFGNLDPIWGDSSIARRVYGGEAAVAERVPPPPQAEPIRRPPPAAAEKPLADPKPAGRSSIRPDLLRRVEDAWQTGGEKGSPPEAVDWDGESPLARRLHTTFLPKFSLGGVSLRSALDAVVAATAAVNSADCGCPCAINLLLLDEPAVDRPIHLCLCNVSAARALEMITRTVNFEWEIDGDTVLVGSVDGNRSRLRTQFFPITRATVLHMTNLRGKAADEADVAGQIGREERQLREFFQNAGVDFRGLPGAGLAFDGRCLIVTQTGKNLERISQILRRYGGGQQVSIETKFIEVQQGALDELQFHLSLARNGGRGRVTGTAANDSLRSLATAFNSQSGGGGDGGIVLESLTVPISNRPPQFPNAANLGQSSNPLVDLVGILDGARVGLLMRALEQQSGSDLLSAPQVTVLSGRTAEITVAQEMRYPEAYDEIQSSVGSDSAFTTSTSAGVTITAGTPRNFTTRNVGVEMSVTPFVEADGRISLQLEPSVTEFEGFVEYGGVSVAVARGATVTVPSGFFQPIFSTRRIRTEVTIDNGATVVMGGLTREEVKEVRDKVPLLGDIPLLGKLFRSKGTSSQKRNLLIFVTARLVDSGDRTTGEVSNAE